MSSYNSDKTNEGRGMSLLSPVTDDDDFNIEERQAVGPDPDESRTTGWRARGPWRTSRSEAEADLALVKVVRAGCELVMWGETLMRKGLCPLGSTCLACDRLGYHLEPVDINEHAVDCAYRQRGRKCNCEVGDLRQLTTLNALKELLTRRQTEFLACRDGKETTKMGYGSKSLNDWRDDALRIATEHGFKDASFGEDMALIHSEVSEALEDFRDGKLPHEMTYSEKRVVGHDDSGNAIRQEVHYPRMFKEGDTTAPRKPCGIPSELADIIIRVLHTAGKHGVDIERAVREKMLYNESRPVKHGGKVL